MHMYLVVGFCKLATTFCVNLNHKNVRYQCIQLQVHWDCPENGIYEFQEKKLLILLEHVKVIDLAVKGKSACTIALSLGIGNMQTQGIVAKKTLILQSWKAGTNGKIKYLTAKQSKNSDSNQRRLKPPLAGMLGQLHTILLDCILFLLFLFLYFLFSLPAVPWLS